MGLDWRSDYWWSLEWGRFRGWDSHLQNLPHSKLHQVTGSSPLLSDLDILCEMEHERHTKEVFSGRPEGARRYSRYTIFRRPLRIRPNHARHKRSSLQVHPSGRVANASIKLEMLFLELFRPRTDAVLPWPEQKLCTAEVNDGLSAPQWDRGREFPHYKTISWRCPIDPVPISAHAFGIITSTASPFPEQKQRWSSTKSLVARILLDDKPARGVRHGEPQGRPVLEQVAVQCAWVR